MIGKIIFCIVMWFVLLLPVSNILISLFTAIPLTNELYRKFPDDFNKNVSNRMSAITIILNLIILGIITGIVFIFFNRYTTQYYIMLAISSILALFNSGASAANRADFIQSRLRCMSPRLRQQFTSDRAIKQNASNVTPTTYQTIKIKIFDKRKGVYEKIEKPEKLPPSYTKYLHEGNVLYATIEHLGDTDRINLISKQKWQNIVQEHKAQKVKQEAAHYEKVVIAYRCYKEEIVSSLFPKGISQASNIVYSLAEVCDINLEKCDVNYYREILTLYSDVFIRTKVTPLSNRAIMASLKSRHGNIVQTQEQAMKILAFCILHITDNEFALLDSDSLTILNSYVEYLQTVEQNIDKNINEQNKYLDDAEYGLVRHKPIYTSGVPGSNKYLSELRTVAGENIVWSREGSVSVDGINGMIDVYVGTLPSGEEYKTLYINIYSTTNSTKIPQGFIKVSSDNP